MKKLLTVLVALTVAFVFAGAVFAEEAKIVYGQKIGDVAKPVKLKDIENNKEVDTSKLAKKSLFVFVNTVCGMCQREMADLEKGLEGLDKVDLYIVVVDQAADRALKKYEKFLGKSTMLHDPEFQMGENVGLYSTPSTLILEKDGKIVFKESGYQPALMKSLKAAL